MEPLMNEERLGHECNARQMIASAQYFVLGFTPAYLDFGTQTIYPTCWSPILIPGFERDGFFYTRTAAAKAVVEWSLPPN
ncbi:hypothetical protein BWI17_20965 [Betaproteobacteria bacterium GR16-43]|nr:hypothetical protein BWI17_20965 [Betaproteobacteria bacterium GR16-43]